MVVILPIDGGCGVCLCASVWIGGWLREHDHDDDDGGDDDGGRGQTANVAALFITFCWIPLLLLLLLTVLLWLLAAVFRTTVLLLAIRVAMILTTMCSLSGAFGYLFGHSPPALGNFSRPSSSSSSSSSSSFLIGVLLGLLLLSVVVVVVVVFIVIVLTSILPHRCARRRPAPVIVAVFIVIILTILLPHRCAPRPPASARRCRRGHRHHRRRCGRGRGRLRSASLVRGMVVSPPRAPFAPTLFAAVPLVPTRTAHSSIPCFAGHVDPKTIVLLQYQNSRLSTMILISFSTKTTASRSGRRRRRRPGRRGWPTSLTCAEGGGGGGGARIRWRSHTYIINFVVIIVVSEMEQVSASSLGSLFRKIAARRLCRAVAAAAAHFF